MGITHWRPLRSDASKTRDWRSDGRLAIFRRGDIDGVCEQAWFTAERCESRFFHMQCKNHISSMAPYTGETLIHWRVLMLPKVEAYGRRPGKPYGCMAAFLFTGVGTSGTLPWFAWTAFHCARERFERLSALPPCKGRGRFCYSCWSRLLSSAENAV